MLFLLRGYYTRKRRLGLVADFCIRCQQARRFEIYEVLRYRHFYFIPVPLAALQRHEVRCSECNTITTVEPQRYASFIVSRGMHFDQLIQQTHPNLWDELERRTLIQNRIDAGEATPEERAALAAEIIGAYEPEAAKRASQMMIDSQASMSLLAAVVVPLVTLYFCKMTALPQNWVGPLTIGEAGLFLGWAFYLVATDVRRYCRRELVPLILPVLARYRPVEEDLREALAHLRGEGRVIGRKVRAAELFADLQAFLRLTGADR